MPTTKTAIGLMSGTSMDGIDAALLRSDGKAKIDVLCHLSLPYKPAFKNQLKSALKDAEKIKQRNERPGSLKEVERALTHLHTQAVHSLLKKAGISATAIDLIGFHGQTVLHRPDIALTVQLGDGALLAKECGIDVIFDMRANDMMHGGQGAPLVPIYHEALAQKYAEKLSFPVAFVNIGGISNLTWVDGKGGIIAFDCGPGNALIDQWIKKKSGADYDKNGKNALCGTIQDDIVKLYKNHPFFAKNQAGSLDWRDFAPLRESGITIEDGAATLAYITAYGVFHSLRFIKSGIKTMVISGGGAKNAAIMQNLAHFARQHGAQTLPSTDLGLDSDFIEAEAWAYLAVRSFYQLPLTFPTTTGCKSPISGGVLAKK